MKNPTHSYDRWLAENLDIPANDNIHTRFRLCTRPTAFIQIEKIVDDTIEFCDGYAWDTDALTLHAFRRAEAKHQVPFEHAAYLVDLYEREGELLDTFPITELGYRSLKANGC